MSELAHRPDHERLAVEPHPSVAVVQCGLVGEHTLHAVLVDREEQRVLARHALVDQARRYVRTLAHRGDGERLVPALLDQRHAGVEHPSPPLAAPPLLRFAHADVHESHVRGRWRSSQTVVYATIS